MARPIKTGIDYFPFDVEFFSDDKIQLIESEFGMKGGYIAIRLLCKIYKEGYYYKWGTDECLLFTRSLGVEGVSKNFVDEVISGLIRRCFFDKRCFDKFEILTSKGIQKRYFEATSRYKKVEVIKEYLLIDNINSVNVNIIPINANSNTQKKGKEKKLNNKEISSKDDTKKTAADKSAIHTRKEEFYQTLIPYLEKYGKDMIRKFFDYWSEFNRSQTKMKFELEKTWETPKRLAKWSDYNYNQPSKDKIPSDEEFINQLTS